MCDKNLLPRPSPLEALLTRPAISMNSNVAGVSFFGLKMSFKMVSLSSGTLTIPTFGSIVQNG